MNGKTRMQGKLFSVVLALAMLVCFMPQQAMPAYAEAGAYSALVPTGEENEEQLAAKQVKFNGKPWHIIKDGSTSAGAGTVTLLAADTSFSTSKFTNSTGGVYRDSPIKASLTSMTESGTFKDVANAIVETDNGKLYLLSKGEAEVLPINVRVLMFTGGSTGLEGYWWLRDNDNGVYNSVWSVRSYEGGRLETNNPTKSYGVRPALQLDLSKVVFDSETQTFSPAYGVTLSGGKDAVTSGGATTQEHLQDPMETVTYTAKAGYHFDTFNDIESNGVTAKRTSDKEVTVSGTPTDTVKITIPDAHAYGGWKWNPSPSCNAGGTLERVCANDNNIKETIDVGIDPNAHNYQFEDFTWTGSETDGYTEAVANYVCEHNIEHKTTAKATIKEEVTESTCEEGGKTTYTATVDAGDSPDGQKHEESKDAKATDPTDHDWGEPEYTWAEDNSSLTATRVCKNDGKHKETETVDATAKVTKQATCTEKGETTYTSAAFTNEAFKIQTRTAEDIDATDRHSWDAGKVTKEATETSEGVKTYTCAVCGGTKTESIPKIDPEPTPTPTPEPTPDEKTFAAKPVLVAKAVAKGKTAGNISWNKVKGADRYVIYFARCNYKGKTYALKKARTVNGKTLKWTKTKLNMNTAYKFYVVAQKKSEGSYKTVAKSVVGHFFSGNVRGGYTNPKNLTLKKKAYTLKKGKTVTVKASVSKVKSDKKLATGHAADLRFISNNTKVATVNGKGKITAKAKGTATIYVQTINGIWKTCKVTVK